MHVLAGQRLLAVVFLRRSGLLEGPAIPAATMNCFAVMARTNSSLSRISAKVAQIWPITGADTAAASTHPAGSPMSPSKASVAIIEMQMTM